MAREQGCVPDVRWHLRKDGRRVFIEGTTRVLMGADGVIRGYLKIGRDVTERRQTEVALRSSEARVQAIANMVPDLLWSNDAAGSADWFNDRWREYTGQTLDGACGDGWMDAIHPEARERSVAKFRGAIESGDLMRQEYRIRGAGGEYRWFLVQAVPLRDEHGTVARWVGACTDIHEQRMVRNDLEDRVRERTQQLEDVSRERQQFLDRLLRATELERQRIARELHDELGQHITALRVGLQTEAQTETLSRLKAIVDRLDETTDRLTLEQGLRLLIDSQPDMEVVGEADRGRDAASAVRQAGTDVVLLDVSMPDTTGIRVAADLREALPDVKIVALTRHAEKGYVQQILQNGASGYVLKQTAGEALLEAIRTVTRGGTYLDPAVAGKLFEAAPTVRGGVATEITSREREVLTLVTWGHTNKEIASILGITVKTVESHKTNAMRKLEITSSADLVRYALAKGWLDRH
jgi:PAS domain S-box-containing protein